MTIGSPAAYLLWAILACTFQIFMSGHLWAYDRFNCLKWTSGRQPGAFKRVMTYSYVFNVPMLVFFGVAMSLIKYREGYIVTQDNTIIPKPIAEWQSNSVHWVLPLYFVLSVAWAFELVTHLEELTFWLFLLNQGPSKRQWFHSWEFRVWYLGSMVAVIGMPLVTLMKRTNLDSCLSWIFLSGSSAGAATTVCSLYVIIRFPYFIRQVKAAGADTDVVVRLATFYHLNLIRILFRFFFNFPLIIVGADGIYPPYNVLRHALLADALIMVGGIGCFVSSALTLLIFFPRSLSREYTARKPHPPSFTSNFNHRPTSSSLPRYHLRDPSPKFPLPVDEPHLRTFRFPDSSQHSLTFHDMPPQHHRQLSDENIETGDVDLESQLPRVGETAVDSRRSNVQGKTVVIDAPEALMREEFQGPPGATVHPYVMSYTSPIDLWDEDELPRAI